MTNFDVFLQQGVQFVKISSLKVPNLRKCTKCMKIFANSNFMFTQYYNIMLEIDKFIASQKLKISQK